METEKELGRRERKRLETEQRIEHSALTLILERGLDITVDQIAEAADVSPRTFFNYFPSKEDAFIGRSPSLPSDERVQSYVDAGPDGDALHELVDYFAQVSVEATDRSTLALRRRVMVDHPELFGRRANLFRNYERTLTDFALRRLRADAEKRGDEVAEAVLAERASMMTFVVVSVIRHAFLLWAEEEHESLAETGELITRSFELLRDVTTREPARGT